MVPADLDVDGDLDVVTNPQTSEHAQMTVLLNLGNGAN